MWGDETGRHALLSRGWGKRDKLEKANRLMEVRILLLQQDRLFVCSYALGTRD